MEKYELMVIFKPQMVAEEKVSPLEEVEKLVKSHKGVIEVTDDWGEKSLEYAIAGHDRGYFVVYQLELDAKLVANFTQKMNLNKDLLRWLLVEGSGVVVPPIVKDEEKVTKVGKVVETEEKDKN